jgi:High potential iron-sulfur protein
MQKTPTQKTSRREVILHCVRVVSTACLLPAALRARAAEQTCVDPASASLRESLNYVDPAPDAATQCGACGFFTGEGKQSCGECMIMSGPVSRTAHCDSWGAKGQ